MVQHISAWTEPFGPGRALPPAVTEPLNSEQRGILWQEGKHSHLDGAAHPVREGVTGISLVQYTSSKRKPHGSEQRTKPGRQGATGPRTT